MEQTNKNKFMNNNQTTNQNLRQPNNFRKSEELKPSKIDSKSPQIERENLNKQTSNNKTIIKKNMNSPLSISKTTSIHISEKNSSSKEKTQDNKETNKENKLHKKDTFSLTNSVQKSHGKQMNHCQNGLSASVPEKSSSSLCLNSNVKSINVSKSMLNKGNKQLINLDNVK